MINDKRADRPLVGWGDRYAKGHMDLLTAQEQHLWRQHVDQFSDLLSRYLRTQGFIHSSKTDQDRLLDEFVTFWDLPYAKGLIGVMQKNQRLFDFGDFVEAWKTAYDRAHRIVHLVIQTVRLLKEEEISMFLEAIAIPKESCDIVQTEVSDLLDGIIIDCDNVRYDASLLGQLECFKKELIR